MADSPVVVRFAPSPTGMLHIGGGRTALFNYYFAKRHGGKALLRVEDTDYERSTTEAVDALMNGLAWIGYQHDGEIVFQSKNLPRHAEVAQELLKQGKAYYCYCTPDELEQMREDAMKEGRPVAYDRRWRDRDPSEAPKDIKPTIRIKAPLGDGAITIPDKVQGDVTVSHSQLDDFIILRSDGTPTYMLSVVVDDFDMGITHIIRGDDHLNNTFRQKVIIDAMGWPTPVYAHLPMINGPDGKKLSKRHGATSVEMYRDMGYLPEAMRNYLLRLGWSHGDDEIFSDEQAIAWFDVDHIGRSPSQLDFAKLDFVNAHYMKLRSDEDMLGLVTERFETRLGRALNDDDKSVLLRAMPGLKERAKTLNELVDIGFFYVSPLPLAHDEKALSQLAQPHVVQIIETLVPMINAMTEINQTTADRIVDDVIAATGLKMGQVAPVLRAVLTGTMQSPALPQVFYALGKDRILLRLKQVKV
ncbi:MAG TPA: glutamate--tRNA ligase [Alphaproteobacteria bacterium]